MVHWVYVLKSSTTGSVYVGETTRLYRRWNEHRTGRGGVTTSSDDYDTLIGLYNVRHNRNFLDYYKCSQEQEHDWRCAYYWDGEVDKSFALEVENHITERYKYEHRKGAWWNVKGGKYCREGCITDLQNIVIDRPLCKCGFPCEINMKKDQTKLYFTCPIPDWTAFDDMETPEKCDFWKEFESYRTLREEHEHKRRQQYAEKMRKANLAAYIEATKDD